MDSIGLVFDFDGTLCQLFKNYDLKQTVVELHESIKKYGFDFPLDKDAFEIFEFIGTQESLCDQGKIRLYEEMNKILVSAEMEAVKCCELVNGVDEVFPSLKKSGYNIGVATNNSYECVHEFLNLYCGGINIPIVGRIGSCPELMKPNRWPLVEALKKMNCRVDNSLFLGDTLRDYECAKNACCKFIGVAPTERKLKRLKTIKPEIDIVSDFYELNKKILT